MTDPRLRATGHCLCEGVRYEVLGPLRDVWDCHCDRCRRTTGHHMAATACHLDDLLLLADAPLRWYEPGDAVEYGFCAICGSTLFWRSADTPDQVSICAGTLDPPTGLRTAGALFTAEASDYHTLDPAVPGRPGDRSPVADRHLDG